MMDGVYLSCMYEARLPEEEACTCFAILVRGAGHGGGPLPREIHHGGGPRRAVSALSSSE